MRIALVLTLAACLGGCATGPEKAWFKDGSTQQTFNVDLAECQMRQDTVRASMPPGASLSQALMAQQIGNNCMVAHGWDLR